MRAGIAEAIERFGRVARLDGLGVRRVQWVVQRQDQPGASVLAQPRPRRDPVFRVPRRQINADPVTQEAYSHEVISLASGLAMTRIGDAAYYSYTAPEPDGLRDQSLPVGAWREWGSGSLAILRYDVATRLPDDPRSHAAPPSAKATYEAGARHAGWDTTSLESRWCPTPTQLRQLQTDAAGDQERLGCRWCRAPFSLTCGLCLRRAALYPLSYGRGTGESTGSRSALGRLRSEARPSPSGGLFGDSAIA